VNVGFAIRFSIIVNSLISYTNPKKEINRGKRGMKVEKIYDITANENSLNVNSSSGNKSSEINSAPGFGLLGGLACLYCAWKLRKN
jgi:hypothetical protein